MIGSSQLFSSYSPCARNQRVKIADSSFSVVAGKGTIVISPCFTLHNVLHVPKLSCNLLSISKLIVDQNYHVNFYSSGCQFQDLTTRKMLSNAKQVGGLYFFEDGYDLSRQSQRACLNSISILSENEIMLWHFRLGHPSFYYMRHLFPKLFMNKNPSSFQCEICEIAKRHRTSFPAQPYKATEPFTMIHSDVCGPSRMEK